LHAKLIVGAGLNPENGKKGWADGVGVQAGNRLSGMAKAFSDVFHDDYIAGIWRNDIWNGLSWPKFQPEI
jgi:hypothetical protein